MGEELVRSNFVNGNYKLLSREREIVREWLASKDAAQAEARDEESLSISRQSLSTSKEAVRKADRANRLAISAIIIAIIGIALPFVIGWLKR